MNPLKPAQNLFINFIIDSLIGNLAYENSGIICTYPISSFKNYHLVAVIYLSIEQGLPIRFIKYPQLTSDLTVEIKSVVLDGDKLSLNVSKKEGIKKVNSKKQIKAAYARIKNIYPYQAFNKESIQINYVTL